MAADATIDPREIRALDKAIGDIGVLAGRDIGDVIRKASIRAAASAARDTPLAKKNRKHRRVSEKDRQAAYQMRFGASLNTRRRFTKNRMNRAQFVPWWAKYRLTIYKKGIEGEIFLRTDSALARMKPTPRQGLARMAWRWGEKRVKGYTSAKGPALAGKYNQSIIEKMGSRIQSVTMRNTIPYIVAIAPQSAATGITSARKQIERYDLPRAERKLERDWQRLTRRLA